MKQLASLFGLGFVPGAPGTYGSLAALPLAYGLHVLGGFWLLVIVAAAVFGLGVWAAQNLISPADKDPSWIIIDEVAGQWIALLPVSYGAGMMGVDAWQLWPGWVAGFVLFRLFDIRKPWLVGRADRMGTPLGLMLDDVIAGVFAALGSVVLAALYHGIVM